jgi:hypothetical protein
MKISHESPNSARISEPIETYYCSCCIKLTLPDFRRCYRAWLLIRFNNLRLGDYTNDFALNAKVVTRMHFNIILDYYQES